MNSEKQKADAFLRVLKIMDELRENCPWDKKQTIQSLRHLTIEETYELTDAILENDLEKIKKELGDILLHIVFYSRIASEKKSGSTKFILSEAEGLTTGFDIADVMNSLCEKLIIRHPHIYGDVKVKDENEVKQNWEKIKLREKDSMTDGGFKSALAGVPVSLPSVVKASRIQEKARAVGFDWEKPEQVWEKVQEEISELKTEVDKKSTKEKIEEEFGDVLFSLINYARFIDVNAEDALERTNKKFIKRFQYLESEASNAGKKLSEMSLAEMDVHWNKAKELL